MLQSRGLKKARLATGDRKREGKRGEVAFLFFGGGLLNARAAALSGGFREGIGEASQRLGEDESRAFAGGEFVATF